MRVYVTYLISAVAIGSICCKCQMERAPTHVPIQFECCRKTRSSLSFVGGRVSSDDSPPDGDDRSIGQVASVVWYTWRGLWPSAVLRKRKGQGEGRREGGGKPAPNSVAGCCIPESALMHGLGYVNSHDPMNNVHWVKRPLAISIISNNGASRCDRGKCNSFARYYSPRTPSSREIRQ